MVRVHQPPGGQTHLNEDLPPQPLNVRVLKPPGGGSSISFGEDDNLGHMKSNAAPQQQQQPPQNGVQEKPAEKAESNGTTSPPQTPKDNVTAPKENNPSVAINGTPMNGTLSNGINSTNGTPSSGMSTPSSSRLDTQSRLFGEDPRPEVTQRRVRDHQRSNIFSGNEDKLTNSKPTTPTTPTSNGSETPEPKAPDQPQPQSQQKQRIPPGGFSTKLW